MNKKEKQMKIKQLLAFLLATALVAAMLPTMAFAAAPDSGLSSLSLSGVRLDTSFRKGTTSYGAIASYSTDSTRVRPVAADRTNAAITVNGQSVNSGDSVAVDLAIGSNTISVSVTNGSTTTYTVHVQRLESGQTPIELRTDNLPDGAVGRRYEARISLSGSGDKNWYLDESNLPDGLSFNENTGTIAGTPRAGSEGRYTIYVTVDSSNGTSDSEDYSITIFEHGSDLDDSSEPASRPAPRPAAPAPAAPRPAATAQTSVSTVSQANLLSQAQSRIDSAAAGAAVSLRYRNLGKVELKTLQAIGKAAGNHAMSLGSERQDSDGNVESRVTIDPKKSTKDISLLSSTTISSENCRNVTELMNRYYSNQVSVIRLDQKGAYGQTVTVYAKLDNARLNTNSLKFYSYDSAANKLEALTTGYRVNEAGYVTFNTNVGNYVIVTDSSMRRK
jgi:hypothetical protein